MSSHAFGHATPDLRGRRISHAGSSFQKSKQVRPHTQMIELQIMKQQYQFNEPLKPMVYGITL